MVNKDLVEACSGAVGGLCSTALLYPLDVCKTKFQADVKSSKGGQKRYKGLVDAAQQTLGEQGVVGLYAGLGVKSLHAVIQQFIYFYSYSYLKRRYTAVVAKISTAANLAIAAAAGICTVLVTQPLDTVTAKLQTHSGAKHEQKGLVESMQKLGLAKLYDGLGASLLLTCNPAIQYTAFDQIVRWYLARLAKQRSAAGVQASKPPTLSAFAAFVIGALSKTIATIATYPAIRTKIMLQANSKATGERTALQVISQVWRYEGLLGFFKGMNGQILKTVLTAAVMLMIKEKVSQLTTGAVGLLEGLAHSKPHLKLVKAYE
eukprot:jgi/Chlat1/3924/Chrsp26S04188